MCGMWVGVREFERVCKRGCGGGWVVERGYEGGWLREGVRGRVCGRGVIICCGTPPMIPLTLTAWLHTSLISPSHLTHTDGSTSHAHVHTAGTSLHERKPARVQWIRVRLLADGIINRVTA